MKGFLKRLNNYFILKDYENLILENELFEKNRLVVFGLTPYKTEHFSNLLLSSLGFFRYFLPK